jgi:uncharacterized protein YjgD (DUF1641 family)
MSGTGTQPELTDDQVQALVGLLNALAQLKRSGLLGLLEHLADNADEAFLAAATDPAIMRAVGLLGALARGLERVDGDRFSDAQNVLSDVTSCLADSLGKVDVSKPRKMGLLSLSRRLSDPDVAQGLGLLLDLAKEFGACARTLRAGK